MSSHAQEDERLLCKIKCIHTEKRSCYGSPRIHAELNGQGEHCGRKRVARLMRENAIQAKHKRKFKATTDSQHKFPVAPNLLKQNFTVSEPNRVWTADITYCATLEGWVYLAVVLDMYSRKIVGWSISKRMTRDLVIDAFLMATGLENQVPSLFIILIKEANMPLMISRKFWRILELNPA